MAFKRGISVFIYNKFFLSFKVYYKESRLHAMKTKESQLKTHKDLYCKIYDFFRYIKKDVLVTTVTMPCKCIKLN